ncbi:MAG: hypothetical protein JRJ68_03280 [Deltaproteobacteria bacterium]|nr:hypothetical protein [Deltaproteobacteria bacterium]
MGDENKDTPPEPEITGENVVDSLFQLTSDTDKNEPPAGDPPAGDPPAGDPPSGDPPEGDPPEESKPNRPAASLSDILADIPEDGGDPPAGDPPAGDPPAGDPPAGETPPAKKEPVVKYKKPSGPADELPTFEPSKDPPAGDPPAGNPDQELLDDLLPQEKYEYELAKFASEQMGDQHKGLDEKMLKFFKAHRDYVKQAREKDPTFEPNANDYEYKAFLDRERPNISDVELLEMRDRRNIHEATVRASAEANKETEKLKAENKQLHLKPQIEQRVKEYQGELYDDVVPQHVKDAIAKDGDEGAQKAFGLEYGIIQQGLARGKQYADELVAITKGAKPMDSANNPVHAALEKFVDAQGQAFWETGGADRVVDGKQFLPIKKYNEAVAAGQGEKYWSFDSEHILSMLKISIQRSVNQQIDSEYKRLESYGWKRPENSAAPVTPPAGDPPASKATTPPPRSSQHGDIPEGKAPEGNTATNLLGYHSS